MQSGLLTVTHKTGFLWFYSCVYIMRTEWRAVKHTHTQIPYPAVFCWGKTQVRQVNNTWGNAGRRKWMNWMNESWIKNKLLEWALNKRDEMITGNHSAWKHVSTDFNTWIISTHYENHFKAATLGHICVFKEHQSPPGRSRSWLAWGHLLHFKYAWVMHHFSSSAAMWPVDDVCLYT